MKIIKFTEFINEGMNDTPESYISMALMKIKRKIDRMFEESEGEGDFIEPQEGMFDEEKKKSKKEKSIKNAKEEGAEESEEKMTFKDLGVRLESSEISKYSKLYDSLTVKFSDDMATYALIILIDLKDGISKDPSKDFSEDDIQKCYIKFKKYDIDTFDIVGQITKNVEIKKIKEEFLIDLKIELDEKFDEKEDLGIETKKKEE